MATLSNVSVAMIMISAAWVMRSDPIVVLAGYVCAIHAERAWDLLCAGSLFCVRSRVHMGSKNFIINPTNVTVWTTALNLSPRSPKSLFILNDAIATPRTAAVIGKSFSVPHRHPPAPATRAAKGRNSNDNLRSERRKGSFHSLVTLSRSAQALSICWICRLSSNCLSTALFTAVKNKSISYLSRNRSSRRFSLNSRMSLRGTSLSGTGIDKDQVHKRVAAFLKEAVLEQEISFLLGQEPKIRAPAAQDRGTLGFEFVPAPVRNHHQKRTVAGS